MRSEEKASTPCTERTPLENKRVPRERNLWVEGIFGTKIDLGGINVKNGEGKLHSESMRLCPERTLVVFDRRGKKFKKRERKIELVIGK